MRWPKAAEFLRLWQEHVEEIIARRSITVSDRSTAHETFATCVISEEIHAPGRGA